MPVRGMVLYGTRPEAIKMAPVIEALRDTGFSLTVVNSGQHDSLMPTIMALFGITVDHTLNVLSPGQSLSDLTKRLLHSISDRLDENRPDFIVVQGDTTTAFAGALSAFYHQIPVAHVEAGLRTFIIDSPFPEEASRRMISAMATWNFCPSAHAAEVLVQERAPGQIVVTGNPVVDALAKIRKAVVPVSSGSRHRVVATIHRRENLAHLESIFTALARIADWPDVEVILPVHANPAIQSGVQQWLTGSKVRTMAPLDYLPWIQLLESATLVITDSGGLQEEAPVLGIPLLVARESTERSEVIDQGYGYLAGTTTRSLVDYAERALAGTLPFKQGSPYGDGDAGRRISAILTAAFHGQ